MLLLALSACGHKAAPTPVPVAVEPAPPARANPLLTPSTLPLGYPAFDQIQDADFAPAFEIGMTEQRQEVDAIAKNPAPATLENTLVALERSGATLTRVARVFSNLTASDSNEVLQALEADIAPRLSAHTDAIFMDAALFARVDALHVQRASLGLDAESLQLLNRYHLGFVRAGARLAEADKATLKALNEELSTLTTQFEQNSRKAMKEGGVVVESQAELKGLSEGEIGAAAAAATARGLTGKWVITLQNTTTQPSLAALESRALRERIFRASSDRARAGELDNTSLVSKIVELRAKKAALLGYPTFAAYALEDETAGNAAAVNAMLGELGKAALVKAKQEAKDLQAIINKQAKSGGPKFTLEPWDWAYYAEQDRKARFDFDESQVKPYFELDRVVRDGVFYSATQLYGITFVERKDLPTYDPTVRVYEVHNADGSMVGILLLDYLQRESKRGGAWMSNFVDQAHLLGQRPVIINNMNIAAGAPGEPVLLTFDQVTTMFHEFGHALHGLFADTKYPLLSGTATPPDFVEYPSQFNEMWASDPGVLGNYGKHYQTGEPMPKALFDKVIAAQNYGGGYGTLEYIEAAKIDMVWHELAPGKGPDAAGVMAFESAAIQAAGLEFAAVPPRYHTPYFTHVFAGGGYEAGYYAYIWSEVLARDSGAWFTAHGGLTRENGDIFRAKVLSRGRTAEPSALFADFYGKAPDVGPLLEYRGLK